MDAEKLGGPLGEWEAGAEAACSPMFGVMEWGGKVGELTHIPPFPTWTALGQGPCVLSSLLFRAWHMGAGTK